MSSLGNKEVFARNLNHYLTISGRNQKELCSALGFSESTFSDWMNAKSYPRIDRIEMMANYFGILKSDLIEEHSSRSSGVSIKVLGYVRAGIPISAIEDVLDYEEITERMAAHGTYFGLKIKGDSMEPRISEGDIVIVRQQDDAESGDIVIALINGDDATCKKLMKYENGIRLVPLNPMYEPLYFTNEEIANKPVKIIGKVVENRQKY